MDDAVYKQNPIGGMLIPTAEFTNTMIPKATGSSPMDVITGNITGSTTIMLDIVSSMV
jgi:hypothetical protein